MSSWFPASPSQVEKASRLPQPWFQALHHLDSTDGTVQLRNIHSARVLVPRPSETDPNDPLRWSRWKKHGCFLSICAFSFLTNFAIAGLGPAFYILSLEYDKTQNETSYLLTWPILALGVFNFFWVPLANYFGKRPVFVFTSGVLCAACIWGAMATSFDSLLWSTILAAFAGAASEALAVSTVNDLYFTHERGAKMGLYMNAISGGTTLGPLICGFVITDLSWRWYKGIAVILTAINFVAIVFLVPETRFSRERKPIPQKRVPSVPPRLPPLRASTHFMYTRPSSLGMSSRTDSSMTLDLFYGGGDWPASSGTDTPRSAWTIRNTNVPKKTRAREMSLWSGTPPNTNFVRLFLRPMSMVLFPCVLFASLSYAVSIVISIAVGILNPFVLQAPPYSWKPSINGLIYIPGFIGNVVGGFAGGWLVDKFVDWRARKNRGFFEPETRLVLLVLPLLIGGAGCVLFGYGVQRQMHWATLFFGYGMMMFALAVPAITMAYVSECLLPVNADALVLVNGTKNILSFGFLYAIMPWVNQVGYEECFGIQAAVYVGVLLLGMAIFIPFGGHIRRYQARWPIIL